MNGFSLLNLKIGYSARLIQCLFIIHLSAVIALSLTALPFKLLVLMLIGVTFNLHFMLFTLLRSQTRKVELCCLAEQRVWYVKDAQGVHYSLVNIEHFSHLKWLILVKVNDTRGRRHWVVIARDAVETTAFRRMTVMLQYHLPVLHPANKNLLE